jgi:polyribonucleotide nucleotidyltransferase
VNGYDLRKKEQKEWQAKKKTDASEKRKKKASKKERTQDDDEWKAEKEMKEKNSIKKKTPIKKKTLEEMKRQERSDLIEQDTTSEEFSSQVEKTVARINSELKKVRDSILEETNTYKILQYHDFVDECDDKMLLAILDHLSNMHSNLLLLNV